MLFPRDAAAALIQNVAIIYTIFIGRSLALFRGAGGCGCGGPPCFGGGGGTKVPGGMGQPWGCPTRQGRRPSGGGAGGRVSGLASWGTMGSRTLWSAPRACEFTRAARAPSFGRWAALCANTEWPRPAVRPGKKECCGNNGCIDLLGSVANI